MTDLKEDYKTLILQRLQQRDMFVDRWQKIISDYNLVSTQLNKLTRKCKEKEGRENQIDPGFVRELLDVQSANKKLEESLKNAEMRIKICGDENATLTDQLKTEHDKISDVVRLRNETYDECENIKIENVTLRNELDKFKKKIQQQSKDLKILNSRSAGNNELINPARHMSLQDELAEAALEPSF